MKLRFAGFPAGCYDHRILRNALMAELPVNEPPAADFFMAALWDAAQPVEISVPGYTILGEISRGGMGAVYHALQLRPEREVALKVLLPHLAEEPEMLARFQLEARAMAALDHPGILPVYEVGEADGMPFFSMKLATGGTLSDRLKNGPIPPKEAAALMIQLTRAVHHAHQHGVLHRDLKPGNFLFMEDGRACVTDFGLAKLTVPDHGPLTRTESFFGTPHYMPPEVAAGSVGDATVAGDLYSMGAVLYECLTGRRPHPAKENVAALLRSIADDPVVPPVDVDAHLPRDLSIVCMKSLERKPSDRYATLDAFADDLQRWLDGRPIKARPVGTLEAAWRWARRHPLPAGLIAALGLVMVTGTILISLALLDARRKLHRSLIDQARSERLLGAPGHRDRAMAELRQASELARTPEIRDEAAALLARPDVSPNAVVEIPPKPGWPGDPIPDDKTATSRVSPDGSFALTVHDSGTARLWRKGAGKVSQEWTPPAGGEIIGDFTPDGASVVLAGTERGVIVADLAEPVKFKVLAPPGPMAGFLTIDPAGRKVALARVDGIEVLDLKNPAAAWHFGSTQARCAAVWSADGERLVVSVGDRREAVVLAAENGAVCTTVPVTGSPQQLAFHPEGTLLAVASDDGVIALCEAATGTTWTTLRFSASALEFSKDGKHLTAKDSEGAVHQWPVALPAAFQEWREMPRGKADDTVLDMALSPDGSRILTIATGCVAVWSVKKQCQTGFHLLENQRLDAKASAWWLGDREILVQIPGGLEKLTIDAAGKPGPSSRVPRMPGSTVLDVGPDGGWIVSITDEDGNKACELWPQGNPGQARPAQAQAVEKTTVSTIHAKSGFTATSADGDGIEVRHPDGAVIKLTPPLDPGVRGLLFSHDGGKLIVLTRSHRVFSWDLKQMETMLDENGL